MGGGAKWADHSDEAVVRRGVEGDSDALAELYRRYTRMVWKIIHASVADPHARLDVHQAVFERVVAKLETVRDGSAFRPWIAQVTRRAIIDHHRAVARRSHVELDDVDDREIESPDASPAEWAEMRGLVGQLRVAMKGLGERDAQVLCLCAGADLGAGEIAEHLGIERDHARVVLHRARNRLRGELALT